MSSITYTEIFNEKQLVDFNDELGEAIIASGEEKEQMMVGAVFFGWLGAIGAPLVAATIGAIACGIAASHYNEIRDTTFEAKRITENYEDLLQDNREKYDVVKLKLTCSKYTYTDDEGNKKEYLIPENVECVGIHVIGMGWKMPA